MTDGPEEVDPMFLEGTTIGRDANPRSETDIRFWCANAGIEFEVIHTSWHADAYGLLRHIEGIKPQRLVPIHTLAADRDPSPNSEILRLADGEWLTL